jgi:hypothetical protein
MPGVPHMDISAPESNNAYTGIELMVMRILGLGSVKVATLLRLLFNVRGVIIVAEVDPALGLVLDSARTIVVLVDPESVETVVRGPGQMLVENAPMV